MIFLEIFGFLSLSAIDILDILMVAVILYVLFRWIRGSSAMNIYDIRYAYLKITERQTLIPNETNLLYNYPSYYMGPVGSLSGYCELVNIRFSSTATHPEIEEIESLLRNGVIL